MPRKERKKVEYSGRVSHWDSKERAGSAVINDEAYTLRAVLQDRTNRMIGMEVIGPRKTYHINFQREGMYCDCPDALFRDKNPNSASGPDVEPCKHVRCLIDCIAEFKTGQLVESN